MRTIRQASLGLAISLGCYGAAFAAQSTAPPMHSKLNVQLGLADRIVLTAGASAAFETAFKANCKRVAQSDVQTVAVGGALVGLVVDWLFGRFVSSATDKLKKTLATYSASYESKESVKKPFDPTRWGVGPQPRSCLLVQRVVCSSEDEIACATSARAVQSQLVLLENRTTHLLALPVAIEVSEIKARHNGGKAALAAGLRIEALGYQPERGGQRWSSGDIVLFEEEFKAEPDGKGKPAAAKHSRIDSSPDWSEAVAIPMPPLLSSAIPPQYLATLTIGIAEIGEAPALKKALLAFLDDSGSDVAGVFSAAAKKKLGLD